MEFCLFCLKSVEGFRFSNEEANLYKFLSLLKRYVETDISLTGDDGESSRNGDFVPKIFNGQCCKDCYKIVDSFCDLYGQMKQLELKINWKISSLTDIVSSVDKADSREEWLQNIIKLEDTNLDGEDYFEHVWKWRGLLLRSCARKLGHSYPKLVVKRCEKNGPIFAPLSPPCSLYTENSKMSNDGFDDNEEMISGNVEISTLQLELVSGAGSKNYLGQSAMEFETPVQSPSPVVNNLIKNVSSVELHEEKKSTKKKVTFKRIHRTTFTCLKCPKLFPTRIQLKYHKLSHLQGDREVFKKSKLVKTRFANGSKNSSISNLKNLTTPDISQEKELLEEKSSTQVEENGDDVPRVNSELSEISPEKRKYTLKTPSPETTFTNRLRTVYKCNICCKTFSSYEKELIHETTHSPFETEESDLSDIMSVESYRMSSRSNSMSSRSEEKNVSEAEIDRGHEKSSDSSSSIDDPQDNLGGWRITQDTLDSLDAEFESSTRTLTFLNDAPVPPVNEDVEEESDPLPIPGSSTSFTNSEPFPELYRPPDKVIIKRGSSTMYECECKKRFSSIRGYRLHRSRIHKTAALSENTLEPNKSLMDLLIPKYSCSEANCSKKFVMERELENHKRQHGTFSCEGCPEIKTFAPDLALHEARHSSKTITGQGLGKNVWNCFRCDLSIKQTGRYIMHHVEKHLQVPPVIFTCPICRKCFPCHDDISKGTLYSHFKTFHDVSGMEPESVSKCSHCSAYFRTKAQLQSHMNNNNRCIHCGKTFFSETYLIKHQLNYHG